MKAPLSLSASLPLPLSLTFYLSFSLSLSRPLSGSLLSILTTNHSYQSRTHVSAGV